MGNKIIILQPAITEYRVQFYLKIIEGLGESLAIFSSSKVGICPSIISTKRLKKYVQLCSQRVFFGNRFCWQNVPFKLFLRSDLVLLNFNTRYFSNWAILFLRFVLGKRTYLWGHLEGRNPIMKWVRMVQIIMCDRFLCYSYSDAKRLLDVFHFRKVGVIPNSCVSENFCNPVYANCSYDFIYVGRFVKEKKVKDLLDGFLELCRGGNRFSKLHLVGDGPLLQYLSSSAFSQAELKDRVIFHGFVWEEEKLRSIYSNCLASVSPGYVGLSVIQSFAFGVPCVISKNEHHSPEIETAVEGFNSVFFEGNEDSSLSNALASVYEGREDWLARRDLISKHIRENYTFEKMADRAIYYLQAGVEDNS